MATDKVAKRKKKSSGDEVFVIGRSDLTPAKKKKRPVEDEAPVKKKKKRPVEDGAPAKKKKKRSVPLELELADFGPKKRKSRKDRDKRTPEMARKKFDIKKKKLDDALDDIDIEKLARNIKPGERDYLEEYVWMFNRVGRLIRAAEERAFTSGQAKDIYALNVLINQQREIIADIRTLTDMSGQMIMIRDMVLQPLSSALAQNLLDSYYQLRRLTSETSLPKETQFALGKLEEVTREMSKFIQIKYNESVDVLERVMSGQEIAPSDEPQKKKKRKKQPV